MKNKLMPNLPMDLLARSATSTRAVIALTVVLFSTSASAELYSRLDGKAIYDSDLNVTWLADANYAATDLNASGRVNGLVGTVVEGHTVTSVEFGQDPPDFIKYNGLMGYWAAKAWAGSLTVAGVTGWRLPTTLYPDTACSLIEIIDGQEVPYGYGCTGSEMGHLFYIVLGGQEGQSISVTHNQNYNLFSNINDTYRSQTDFPVTPPGPLNAAIFTFGSGYQLNAAKEAHIYYAWALRSGDVPATVSERLVALQSQVADIGPGKSLADKVALAQTYYAVPDLQATCAVLTAFVNEVGAQRGKKLTAQQADDFTVQATAIMDAIDCSE